MTLKEEIKKLEKKCKKGERVHMTLVASRPYQPILTIIKKSKE